MMAIWNQILVICRKKFFRVFSLVFMETESFYFPICHVYGGNVLDTNGFSDNILLDIQSIWPLGFWAFEKRGHLSECLTQKSHPDTWRLQWLSLYLTPAWNSGCPSFGSCLPGLSYVPSAGLSTSQSSLLSIFFSSMQCAELILSGPSTCCSRVSWSIVRTPAPVLHLPSSLPFLFFFFFFYHFYLN